MFFQVKKGQPQIPFEPRSLRCGRSIHIRMANDCRCALERQANRADCGCDLLVDSILEANSRIAGKELEMGMARNSPLAISRSKVFLDSHPEGGISLRVTRDRTP